MIKMFKKILIANRGEIAARIIRACRDLGIGSVAVYSEGDSRSPHLKMADETVCVGASASPKSYLNRQAILQAALNSECQAVHPGFGFLAEDDLFASMCQQQKLTFIGPSPKSIATMGNKSLAKETVKQGGIPTIPGSQGNLPNLQRAEKLAEELTYPVLLKAVAGGGGKGIRRCDDIDQLRQQFPEASMEAEKSFGCGDLYMEKLIQEGRHIEFQILADHYGGLVHLGERECSIQRRNQKLIEEAPSPALSNEIRTQMGETILRAFQTIPYQNAGTIEFLMDQNDQLYFMEMNTRLQVEHPVTEMISDVDIVQEQIRIACNRPLTLHQPDIKFRGHAIECRINAEDPSRNFMPSPGTLTQFCPPKIEGPGRIRIDTHVDSGYEIPTYYDSMICKLIAWGENRMEAIDTMRRGLEAFLIEGVETTIPLHLDILNSDYFISGDYHTQTLTQRMEE